MEISEVQLIDLGAISTANSAVTGATVAGGADADALAGGITSAPGALASGVVQVAITSTLVLRSVVALLISE